MGTIYCVTGPNGKRYIGQTRRSVNKRWKEHLRCQGSCILLESAIAKYGSSSFTFEVLLEINDQFLNEYECKFIDMFDTLEPNGYNIMSGGVQQSEHSIESRERMRQAKLGPKNHNFGKSRTEETKRKISEAKSGEKHHFYGKTFSEEHKLALSKAHKCSDLPMYMVYVKPRPQQYQADGYAIVHHPVLKNKYFTSKSLTIEEKLVKAQEYLQSYDMGPVQRLNGDGLLCTSTMA